MFLIEVITKQQKDVVKHIIENHHSYVPTNSSVGRRIDWLIYENNEFGSGPIGMIGLGSSVYPPPKDILVRMGVSKDEYRSIFNSVANNWRFCMTKSVKNLATRVLKELRTKAPQAWNTKYNNELRALITFVGGGNNGAVYLADNWELIGKTAGLPDHKSSSMKWDNGEELKQKFVKPTGENQKLILFKDIRSKRERWKPFV